MSGTGGTYIYHGTFRGMVRGDEESTLRLAVADEGNDEMPDWVSGISVDVWDPFGLLHGRMGGGWTSASNDWLGGD